MSNIEKAEKLDIYAEICDMLDQKEVSNRHSYFQMKYFIVMKEPTHQARLWRCLREIEARKQALDAMKLEIEDTRDHQELLQFELGDLELKVQGLPIDSLEYKKLSISKRSALRKQVALEGTLASLTHKYQETLEEAMFFVNTYKNLEKKAPLKPFDDFESQKEYWNEKISQEFHLMGLLGQPVGLELVKTALALEDSMPIKQQLIQKLTQTQNTIIQKKLGGNSDINIEPR